MEIINAQYIDRNNTVIRAVIDGTATSVPVCPGNREYDEIVRQGVEIVPYVAPVVSLSDRARAELARTDALWARRLAEDAIAVSKGVPLPAITLTMFCTS